MSKSWRVAIASIDGKVINEHFGRAKEFYIVDIESNGTVEYTGKRAVVPLCNNGEHDEQNIADCIASLSDCTAVMVAKIGPAAKRALEINNISVFEKADYIESAVSKLADYFIKTNY